MYVIDYLQSHQVPFESLLHQPASSATRRAGMVHVPGCRVAKAVLVKTGDSFAIVLLPSTHRIDLRKLSDAVGMSSSQVRLATDRELADVLLDCELGAVPPLGRLYGMPTVIDAQLAAQSELVIGGNMRHEGLRMRFHDFASVAEPIQASFSQPIAAERQPVTGIASDRLAG